MKVTLRPNAIVASLQVKILCVTEWILTLCLITISLASWTGLFEIKHIHQAISSVSYTRHEPFKARDSLEEKYWLDVALNLEILVLILAQGSLSFLLLVAVQKSSKELYKIWIAVHLLLTVVICLPLIYQYALLTPLERLNIFSQGKIKIVIVIVWICYRFLSFLVILLDSPLTHCFDRPQVNKEPAYANFQ